MVNSSAASANWPARQRRDIEDVHGTAGSKDLRSTWRFIGGFVLREVDCFLGFWCGMKDCGWGREVDKMAGSRLILF